jgi:hypothetical protein
MTKQVCLEGLRKITKDNSQDSWPPGQEMNLGSPHEAGVVTTQLSCFMLIMSSLSLDYQHSSVFRRDFFSI